MPVKRRIPDTDGLYFITFTCWKWFPLFELTAGYHPVYKWFDILENDGHQICGFVIMPNHVHTMIHFKRVKKSINQTISNGKRFLSYAWVVKWKETNCINVVRELQAAVKESDRAKGKIHQVFRHSFDWKECREDRVIM